jgi:hypothetical protein
MLRRLYLDNCSIEKKESKRRSRKGSTSSLQILLSYNRK